MINKIQKEWAKKLFEQKQEARKEQEENREKGKLLKDNPRRFFLVKDKPFYLSFLHPYEDSLDLLVHIFYTRDKEGKLRTKHILCENNYMPHDPVYKNCPYCQEPDDWGGKNKPHTFKCMIAYVHNFEGETFNNNPINPVRIVELRFGKGAANINSLVDDDRKGKFQKAIFIQKRTGEGKDTVYEPLKAIPRDREWTGEQFDPEVPREILEQYGAYTSEQIATEILLNYENVKWDLWGIPDPSIEDSAPAVPIGKSKAKEVLK